MSQNNGVLFDISKIFDKFCKKELKQNFKSGSLLSIARDRLNDGK